MDLKTAKKNLEKSADTMIKVITVLPILRKLLSFKSVAVIWIFINSYLLMGMLVDVFTDGDYSFDMIYGDTDLLVHSIVMAIKYVSESVIIFYLIGVFNRSAKSKRSINLNFAKSLGMISNDEYDRKMTKAQLQDYVDEVEKMYDVGIFNELKKNELLEMANNYYTNKSRKIGLKIAYGDGILTKNEYEEKLKSIV